MSVHTLFERARQVSIVVTRLGLLRKTAQLDVVGSKAQQTRRWPCCQFNLESIIRARHLHL